MQCPKCGFQNPPDAKYCQRCANIFVSPDQSKNESNQSNEPKIEVMPQHQREEKKQERSSLMPESYSKQYSDTGEDIPLKKWSKLFKDSIITTWSKNGGLFI